MVPATARRGAAPESRQAAHKILDRLLDDAPEHGTISLELTVRDLHVVRSVRGIAESVLEARG